MRPADTLSILRAATSECAATARLFSTAQLVEVLARADELRAVVARATATTLGRGVVGHRTPLLLELPSELFVHVLRHLDVRSLGRLACTCREFYRDRPCPPRPKSLLEEELRRRAEAAGRWLPLSVPAGVSGWVPFLLLREWGDSLELGTLAAGSSLHSFFVGANRELRVCGMETGPGTLGLPRRQGDYSGEGETEDEDEDEDDDDLIRTVRVPTLVPSIAGIPIRQVVAGGDVSLAVSEAGRIYMWGQSYYGRLASDEEDREEPRLVRELSGHRVRQVGHARHAPAAHLLP
jgi:hypothetical protein